MFFGTKKSSSGQSKDWADQAAELIEGAIDQLHDKAVVPLTTVARGVVYGLLAAIVGIASAVLVAILAVRLVVVYLPNIDRHQFASSVWLADLVVGLIFVGLGLFLWSKRYPKAQ